VKASREDPRVVARFVACLRSIVLHVVGRAGEDGASITAFGRDGLEEANTPSCWPDLARTR